MSTTRATLLERVRDPRDDAAWEEFFALYAPLLRSYALGFGLSVTDAEDIRDQCLSIVVQRIENFRYDRAKGSFKGWLHRIARDKLRDELRRPRKGRAETALLAALPDEGEGPDEIWERHWRAEHLRFALAEVLREQDGSGRELALLLLDEQLSAAQIAQRRGWSTNQVYKARSRLLADLRRVLRRLGEAE